MFRLFGKIIFNKYLWLVFLPLLLAWVVLMERLQTRTDKVSYTQMDAVKRIWGGNLEQPMPSLRYKNFGTDVATLTRGEITSSAIDVTLTMDYRKKGLVYYTGYNAEFKGIYTFRNPQQENIYLSFIFPYPMQQGEGILQDLKLLVNEAEDVANTEYQPTLALWTGLLEAEQTVTFTLQYHGRGLNHFIYGFERGTQVNQFRLTAKVLGAKNVDYPVETMTPTTIANTAEGVTLTWELDRSLTELNLGVLLPDRLNVARQISVMTSRAPAFFVLFLVSICVILKLIGKSLNFLKIAAICAAYFLFYPLFAYLSMYMTAGLSFALSFGILGIMIFYYTLSVDNLKTAGAVTLAYTFFLGITSLAALFPTYTGLILVIEAVVLLGVAMQVLAHYRDAKLFEVLGLSNLKIEKPPKKPAKKPTTPIEPPPLDDQSPTPPEEEQ